MGNRKMKKFFATMMIAAMLCPSMVYADTLDAAALDGDLVLVTEDDQQFLSEEPSDEIVIDEEEGSDQEPFYEEEYDLDQAVFEADEEYSYSADEDTYNGGLEPDGDTPSVEAVGLATGWLKNPQAVPNFDNWHHVYFGKYNNQPVSYRVLEITPFETSQNPPKTNVLLDCDVLLYNRKYNYPESASAAGEEWRPWKDSDLKPNVDNCFGALYSAVEQNAIKTVSIADGEDNVESKVYLFSKDDVNNESYGITSNSHRIKNIIGTTTPASWWLRTTDTTSVASQDDAYIVKADGSIGTNEKCDMAASPVLPYVSPVINIDPASVIYTSRIGGSSYSYGTKYKFTLKDSNLSIALQGGTSVTRSVNTITVPYSITDNDTVNDPTRVSLLLLKHSYTAGKAVYDSTTATGIKEFCIIPQNESYAGLTETATFTLPDEYEDATCGSGYYAYLIAEDVNGAYETNYASAPFQISVPSLTKNSITVLKEGNGNAVSDKQTAAAGQEVTLTATPESGNGLKEWKVISGEVTLDSYTDNETSFVMGDSSVEVKAIFAQENSVTLSKDGAGNGTVTADPNSAVEGKTVTITAEPADDSQFVEWNVVSGGVTFSESETRSTNSTESFAMGNGPVEIKATFKKIPTHSTTITKAGDGTGIAEVTSTNPAAEGSTVKIKATATDGSRFVQWDIQTEGVKFKTSDKTTSTNAEETFIMGTSDVEIKATFEKETYQITKRTEGTGTITGPYEAKKDDSVTLIAKPGTGFTFKEWKIIPEDIKVGSKTNDWITFSMPGEDVEVTAKFVRQSTPTPTGKHTVTVYSKEGGKTKVDKLTAAQGETVTIEATGNKGYTFHKWQVTAGGVKLSNDRVAKTTFVMGNTDVTVKALFYKASLTLSTDKIYLQKGMKNKRVTVTVKHDKIKKVKSKDKKIATVKLVGSKLQVTGKKAGKVRIRVYTESGLSGTLHVSVKDYKITTKTLKVDKTSVSVKKGKKKTVKVTAKPNRYSTGEKVKVESSDKKIATCSYDKKTGKITIKGVKKGKCKVKVSAGKKSKTIKVEVK